jgi:uncharacterized protein (DUF305 family)
MRKPAVTVLTLVVATMGALSLTACGQDDTPEDEASPSPTFNDTDVAFAQRMIVHHQQAIIMAEMAQTRAQDPQVRRLGAEIEADQQPEIQTLTRLLQAWDRPVPTMTPGRMPHMPTPSGTPHMPRMTPQPDMSPMMDMRGPEFDRMFLQVMIDHHEEAITMARAELQSGANPQARQVAEDIEDSQTDQIAEMRQLLGPSPTRS